MSRNHVRYVLVCKACGEEFIAKRKDAQTCKMACRQQKRRKVNYGGEFRKPVLVKSVKETWVYRVYNRSGTLLYVGITDSPKYRMLDHKAKSVWWSDKTEMTWERFESRSAALAVETLAIQNEYPVFNVVGK